MNLGKQLKETRLTLGISQDTIADKLNTSRLTITSWENNETMPDIPSLILLSEYYHLSLDTLLKEDKRMIKQVTESTILFNIKQVSFVFAIFLFLLLFLIICLVIEKVTFFIYYLLLIFIVILLSKSFIMYLLHQKGLLKRVRRLA